MAYNKRGFYPVEGRYWSHRNTNQSCFRLSGGSLHAAGAMTCHATDNMTNTATTSNNILANVLGSINGQDNPDIRTQTT